MRLVGRQNKCPAVTLEAGSNLVFSLEMIISFATGNRGCNLFKSDRFCFATELFFTLLCLFNSNFEEAFE